MLGGFHVRSLSEQHDTLHHPSGEFFWKFLLHMSFIWSEIWKSLPLGVWSKRSILFLPLQLDICIWCIWSYTYCKALPVFAVPHGPLLSVLHDFTNWPVWHQSESVLSSSPTQITRGAGKPEEPSQSIFFSSKKIHERLPPSLFLSSLKSSTVSWLSHNLLLRMSLTLAKESGISAFCRGLP